MIDLGSHLGLSGFKFVACYSEAMVLADESYGNLAKMNLSFSLSKLESEILQFLMAGNTNAAGQRTIL